MTQRPKGTSSKRIGARLSSCLDRPLVSTVNDSKTETHLHSCARCQCPTGVGKSQCRFTTKYFTAADVNTAAGFETGGCLLSIVPAGHCSVQISQSYFEAWTLPDLPLSANDRFCLGAPVQLGITAQGLEVAGKSFGSQTDSCGLSMLAALRAVQELPRSIGSRQFTNWKPITSKLLAANTHRVEPRACWILGRKSPHEHSRKE
jgi:hypothetical protein